MNDESFLLCQLENDLPKIKQNNRAEKVALTRSQIMQRVKQKDSAAELSLRSSLFKRGLRYRIHRRVEGVLIDIVFVSAKVAVFVDGCFWHGCPIHATFPKSNQSYWLPKLAENKARDLRQTAKLSDAGWEVIRAWEHECIPPSGKLVGRVERVVRRRSLHGGTRIAR